MKKVALLRDMPVEELEDKIALSKAELSKERAVIASGTRAEKPGRIRNLRKGIARMLTLINEKKAKKGASKK